ncbi:MAG: hypothetical protein FWC38_03125 [Proteobacteria bacterium]|nr:hypothetical protein [Pseudomonadota bacterium]
MLEETKRFLSQFCSSARLTNEEVFQNTLEIANDIAKVNKSALKSLVRALLRPIQSERFISVVENPEHKALPQIVTGNFFFDGFSETIKVSHYLLKPTPERKILLNRDIILPTPWQKSRFCDALSMIGKDKEKGAWTQDDNHSVEIWFPWHISFVKGGNHSITAGILAGEGEIVASDVYDFSPIFEHIKCDGKYYKSTDNGQILGEVKNIRIATAFEIGRLMI